MRSFPLTPRAALPVLLGTALWLAVAPAACAQTRIGVVDIGRVYAAYYKVRDAETKIREARELARKELETRDEIRRKRSPDREIAPAGNPRAQAIEEIMGVVSEKARAGKYDLILDKGIFNASGLPFIVAVEPVPDFTDEIITVLNRGH